MTATTSLEVVRWAFALFGLVFLTVLGAVVGSFLNVVVYRLPRGLNLIKPPSACPACGNPIPWHDNLPVVGWIRLGGKCRYCYTRISPEYPLVEALMGLLFGLSFLLWFMNPSPLGLVGVDAAAWRPEWVAGATRTSPYYFLVLTMFSALGAATLIDARTFLIPLVIPWLLTALALLVHPLHALWLTLGRQGGLGPGAHGWTIPLVDGPFVAAAFGGAAGIAISALLLRLGLMPRSFEDYEAWEAEHAPDGPDGAPGDGEPPAEDPPPAPRVLLRVVFLTGPAVALMLLGSAIGAPRGMLFEGVAIGAAVGFAIGLPLRALATRGEREAGPVWLGYPHARREMLKEILFLLPGAALAIGAYALALPGGRLGGVFADLPLPVDALGASVLGGLVGGGIVWAVRIFGTLAIGKEAMGLGDVHLMVGVGAVLGWVDPVLAFFTAPFFGLAWAVLGGLLSRVTKRTGMAIPYGPHLAVASVVVVLAKPLYEAALSALMGGPIDLV